MGLLANILTLKYKDKLDQAEESREANARIAQMIASMALMSPQGAAVLDQFKEPLSRVYSPQQFESLRTAADMFPLLMGMAKVGDRALGESAAEAGVPGITPEVFGAAPETVTQFVPEFVPPAESITRASMTAEGDLTFSQQQNPFYDEKMDAEWARRHIANRYRGISRMDSIWQLANPDPETGWSGWIPSEILAKSDDFTEDEKRVTFARGVYILSQDPRVREKVAADTGLKGAALDDAVLEYSAVQAGLKLGWHDDWANPFFTGITDYQHRQELAQDREAMIMEEMTQRELDETKPIPPDVAAEYGIALGTHGRFPTYKQLINQGYRFMSDKDRELYEAVSATLEVIDDLFGGARQLFTSEDDYASRFSHGINLRWEKIAGTPLGVVYKDYMDSIEAVPRLLLPLLGEQGGRFTDKDFDQIQKQVPRGGVLPSGRGDVARKEARMKLLLLKKLELVYAPKLIRQKGKIIGADGVERSKPKIRGKK